MRLNSSGRRGSLAIVLVFLLSAFQAFGADRPLASGHVPATVRRLSLRAAQRLPATNHLRLAIGLPLRNPDDLKQLIRDLYNPASPKYRHFLTPQQFADGFGPTPEQYETVVAYARSNHLTVRSRHANRLVLDVEGSAAQVEAAFRVRLQLFPHPNQARLFYAPDAEPSVPSDVPVLDVSGLDDFAEPAPSAILELPLSNEAGLTLGTGSGPQGTFMGTDFRNAYVPNVALTGSGQSVALVEFDGYHRSDIVAYATKANVPMATLRDVRVDGATGVPGRNNGEVALDIEMVMAMAPNLSSVIVYEAPNSSSHFNDLLNQIAIDDAAAQISCSWGAPSGPDATTDQIFQQLIAQGQTFFQASGDSCAYPGPVNEPSDNPYVTVVGGTTLTTQWGGGPWQDETVWQYSNNKAGSSGGISTVYSIPDWQQGIDMSTNQGSTTMRNLPDISMAADNIYIVSDNGMQFMVMGTSASAPLWAGFTALVNQQAANNGLAPLGFLNPALYNLAKGPNYTADFHDIVSGNNTNRGSPTLFYAVPGYDLCTGLGSPVGQALIDNLTVNASPLQITPGDPSFWSTVVGQSVSVTNWTFQLLNAGSAPLDWSASSPTSWLSISSMQGTINPGTANATTVTVTLNTNVFSLSPGSSYGQIYQAYLWFTNETAGTTQSILFGLRVQATGSLQVTITPTNAIDGGGQWQIDQGAWQTSGTVVTGLEAQAYTISFSTVSNYIAPGPIYLTLSPGSNSLTVNYISAGYLQTFVGPTNGPNAVYWVDGGAQTISNGAIGTVSAGVHSISFPPFDDWIQPGVFNVSVLPGQLTMTNADYTPAGALQVILGPTGTSAASYGGWQVDSNSTSYYSGTHFSILPGTHVITFLPVSGFITPNPLTVTVNVDQTTVTNVSYPYQYGQLQVFLAPQEAADAGGQWQVDNGPWQTNGAIAPCTVYGSHTIRFSGAGLWAAPAPQTVSVGASGVTTATGLYVHPYKFQTIAGSPSGTGTNDGIGQAARFVSPCSAAVDAAGNVYVGDSVNSTIRQLKLVGTNWVVSTIAGVGGVAGSADGIGPKARFNNPGGIAVDTNGNLFVSDTGNSTVRELTRAGTNWVVSTIAGVAGVSNNADGLGTNALLSGPIGITCGSDGNVYVNDTANYTVRMLAPAGTNWMVTTIAGRGSPFGPDGVGTNAGFAPTHGIAMGPDGRLYVADANYHTDIRLLTATGSNWVVTTIAQGNWTPHAVAVDGKTNLFFTDVNSIGVVTPFGTNWIESSIAGPLWGNYDGLGTAAGFNFPSGIAVDSSDRLFIADAGDHTIRLGTPAVVGNLQVTILPAAIVNSGAYWRVDSGSWQAGGTMLPNFEAGIHTLSFAPVFGWATPTNQIIFVATNSVTAVTATYLPQSGSLRVTLGPAGAVSEGARWQLDGGPWQPNNATLTNLSLGYHPITFLSTSNWAGPAASYVGISANQTATASFTYTPVGSVKASATPSAAATFAQWKLDSGPWLANGALLSGVACGPHTVTFAPVPGWTPPDAQMITVSATKPISVTGKYLPQGTLTVNLGPAGAVNAGAFWAISGRSWQTNGATLPLTASNYTITFAPLMDWIQPTNMKVMVASNQLTTVNGMYSMRYGALKAKLGPAAALTNGARWQIDGGPWQISGATIPVLRGNHTIGFASAPGWVTPASRIVTVGYTATNTVIGTYLQAESTPPTLTILVPSTNSGVWNFPALTVLGMARDNSAVASVWCQLNGGAWALANGTTNWAQAVTLAQGTNLISAYAVDASGNFSRTSTVPAIYGPGARLILQTAGSGTVSPDLNGHLLTVGQSYTLIAKPGSGSVFSDWNGSIRALTPVLTFVMGTNTTLLASFVPSPFPPFAATYSGLFYDTNNPAPGSSGSVRAGLLASGALSGNVRFSTNNISFTGQLTAAGTWSNAIPRKNQPPLAMTMQLDLAGSNLITGLVSDGNWAAPLEARRLVFSAKQSAPQSGKYTLAFGGDGTNVGFGVGMVTVSNAGGILFTGTLADGTRTAAGTFVAADGESPVYAPLYANGGCLIGWIVFTNAPDTDVAGTLYWFKPPQAAAAHFAGGLTNVSGVLGSRYVFTNGAPILNVNTGNIVFLDNTVAGGFTNNILLRSNNTLLNMSSNKLSLTFTPASGQFSGTAVNPATGQTLTVNAVALPKQNAAYGFYLGTNQNGGLILEGQ